MAKRYQGKIALITASSTGIGLAVARRLAQEGATVVVNSRSEKNVNEAVNLIKGEGGKAVGLVCHAGIEEDRKKLVEFVKKTFGGLDVLVANAAVSTHFGSFIETPEKAMDKMYEVNFRGAFSLVKESLPLMQGRKGANIILMSSYAAYEPDPTIGFYSITKTMLVVMAKILSKELASSGVRVNAICPGLIKTKLSKALWDGREEEVISHLGISRLGRTDDISSAVAYVASEEAEFLTGESLVVAGKASARL